MYETTAIAIAKSKMGEHNIEDYILRYRHIRLDSNQMMNLKADNEWYIIIDRPFYIKVESKAGIYDRRDKALREIQHVHTGGITLHNDYHQSTTVKFLQVIPLMDTKTKSV